MRYRKSAFAIVLIALGAVPVAGSTKPVKIHGYVTQVTSPTNFEIEDYRITSDQGLALDFENAGPDVKFALQDLRVGVELQIEGTLDDSTAELKAKSIRIDMDQFRVKPLTAVISLPPKGISYADGGWTGDFVADGQRIHVSPTTKVLFKPSHSDKDLQKKAAKQAKGVGHAEGDADDFGAEVLQSLDQVRPGMLLTYQGKRDAVSGAIQAERVIFMKNDLEPGEAKLWKSLQAQVKAAQGLKPGELKIDKVGKFKLLPNEDVQNYVKIVGTSLVPPYQRDLPASDPSKIPFQFYVVENNEANAFALANGTVVVNSGLLDVLDNEAQLAAVLGHEMAHATQEHTWRQLQFHKTERFGLALASAVAAAYGQYNLSNALTLTQAAIQNGYSRNLENQADRVGLEYMTAAGYDPREAPRVWKQMTKKYGNRGTDFFWSSHDSNATRRSYLMNELRNNYQGIDFSSLKTNSESFHKVQEQVRQSTAKPTVHVR
jgi:Zn-dependent protease with chaperone function